MFHLDLVEPAKRSLPSYSVKEERVEAFPSRALGLRISAAAFLLGPAALHFAVAPEHLREYVVYGVLFVMVGLAQAALAVLIVLRPSSGLLLGGAALSLAVVAVWLMSRTVGLPIAPVPWQPEAVGLPDLLSTLMEWLCAWLLIAADARPESANRIRMGRTAPALAFALIGAFGCTLAGLGAVGVGGH